MFVETYESNSLEREPVLVLVRHLVIEVLPKFNEFGTIDDSYIFLAVAGFYLLLFILVYAKRKAWIQRPLVKLFAEILTN